MEAECSALQNIILEGQIDQIGDTENIVAWLLSNDRNNTERTKISEFVHKRYELRNTILTRIRMEGQPDLTNAAQQEEDEQMEEQDIEEEVEEEELDEDEDIVQ